MAKKKRKMLDEALVDDVMEVETPEMEATIDEIALEAEVEEVEMEVPKKECKKRWSVTVMVMVNSIRYEGVILRRGEQLQMCKKEAQAATRCIIL